jgi:hypothetical protein
MAPSATSEILVPQVGWAKQAQVEKHVHGAEEKTPLEAISHGPIVQAGETVSPFILDANLVDAVFMAILFEELQYFVPSNLFSHGLFLVVPQITS